MLPQFAAQSTAMVCNDIPPEIGDWYRLLLVLWHSEKPVVTGAFSASSLHTLLELLAIESGGRAALGEHPRAIFDVCPSPPLNWSEFASQNLADLARAGVPAEIVSMPLAGATAPVTLAGSIVQHAAECINWRNREHRLFGVERPRSSICARERLRWARLRLRCSTWDAPKLANIWASRHTRIWWRATGA
jgi:hypothetical protein